MKSTAGLRPWTSVPLLLLVLAACTSGDDSEVMTPAGGNTSTAAATSTTNIPPAVDTGWPMYGHDLANTRFNSGDGELTVETIGRLSRRWAIDDIVGVTGTPTVVDGVAFFGDWQGNVRAVDVADGHERWRTAIGGSIIGSPAIEGDAVFASSGVLLFRLDRTTGAVEWQATTNEHPFGQIAASPVVADGLVFQGVASFEVVVPREQYTFRGSIGAYDTESGREVWRLYTTPADPTAGAGVGVWSTPAVDRERGYLYVGTGNTYAEPTAPLADSLLAIEYKTGALVWSQQFTAPDVFSAGSPTGKDADVGASPNLWTSGGRDLVGAGDKAGVYHALDRESGEVVWEATLTPGSVFGGEIGSGALVDNKLVVVSNVGNPETNTPMNAAHVFALDPATGSVKWKSEELRGLIFGPVTAVPGLAFVGTSEAMMAAVSTETGEIVWRTPAPARVGGGASVADGRVMWGYGFTLFDGPGPGGVISFSLEGAS